MNGEIRDTIWSKDNSMCQVCGKWLSRYKMKWYKKRRHIKRIKHRLASLGEIKIYKWSRRCWACGKDTPRVSSKMRFENSYTIGDLKKIDRALMLKYSFVRQKFIKKRDRTIIANFCIHCGVPQGNYYIKDDIFSNFSTDIEQNLDTKLPNDLTLEDIGIYNEKFYDERLDHVRNILGQIHHKDGNLENNRLSNLILLCTSCHAKANKKMRSIRRKILEKNKYKCVVCGNTENLALYHVDKNPDNNIEKNLRIVCSFCFNKIIDVHFEFDFENNCFLTVPEYRIYEQDGFIYIQMLEKDEELFEIIQSIPLFIFLERKKRRWRIDPKAFKKIKNDIKKYLISTGKPYEYFINN